MHLSETNESGLNLTSTLQNCASSLSALHEGSASLCLSHLSKSLITKKRKKKSYLTTKDSTTLFSGGEADVVQI